MIYRNFAELVGKTPLLKADGFKDKESISAEIYAKLECFNPAGSVKDRVAVNMLIRAKEKGLIRSEGKDYVFRDGDIVVIRFNV